MDMRIIDWSGAEQIVDIGDLKDISMITMLVITGDEILLVKYNNGEEPLKADAGFCRIFDFLDNVYTVYDSLYGYSLLEDS